MSELSVFQVLSELEKKNYFLWEQLTEAEQKQFHPLVLMKWMNSSGVSPERLQRVNYRLFSLTKQQQFLKLATAGMKKSRKWQWTTTKKDQDETEALKAIQFVYDTNIRQAQQTIEFLTTEELDEILQEYRDSTDTKEKAKRRR